MASVARTEISGQQIIFHHTNFIAHSHQLSNLKETMQVCVSIEVKVWDLEIVNFKNHFTLTYQSSMVKAKVICNMERKLWLS